MAKWLDFAKHNAALWVTDGGLVLLPIDRSKGFEHVDREALDESLNGRPHDVKWHDDGLPRRLFIPNTDDGRPGMPVSHWLRAFPRSVRREVDDLAVPYPPTREYALENRVPYQFLWRLEGIDHDALAVSDEEGALDRAGVQAFVFTEEDAARFGQSWSPVPVAERPVMVGRDPDQPDVLWGAVGDTKSKIEAGKLDRADIVIPQRAPSAEDSQSSMDFESDSEPSASPAEVNDSPDRREDYGEKIGGARKDHHGRTAVWGLQDWSDLDPEHYIAEAIHRNVDGRGSLSWNSTASDRAREMARKVKRDPLWRREGRKSARHPDQSVLGNAVADAVHSMIPKTTASIRRAARRRYAGEHPLEWALLGAGYAAFVEGLRDRFESPRSGSEVADLVRQEIGILKEIVTDDDFREREVRDQVFPIPFRWHEFQSQSRRLSEIHEDSYEALPAHRQTFQRIVDGTVPQSTSLQEALERFADETRERIEEKGMLGSIGALQADLGPYRPSSMPESFGPLRQALESIDKLVDVPEELVSEAGESGSWRFIREILGAGDTRTTALKRLDDEYRRQEADADDNRQSILSEVRGLSAQVRQEEDSEKRLELTVKIDDLRREARQEANKARASRVNAYLESLDEVMGGLSHVDENSWREAMKVAEGIRQSRQAGEEQNTQSSADEETAGDEAEKDLKIPPVKTGKQPRSARFKHLERDGASRRDGDIDEKTLVDTFGLRAIEYGEWVSQKERQDMLNLSFDSLYDMAEAMGVPTRFMGFGGDLGLALGSRGRGGTAAAHYEPDYQVINLTKTMGAGTLAHEWSHALDHWLCRQNDEPALGSALYISDMLDDNLSRGGTPGVHLKRFKEMVDEGSDGPATTMLAFLGESCVSDDTGSTSGALSPIATHLVNSIRKRVFTPKVLSSAASMTELGYPQGSLPTGQNSPKAIAASWQKRLAPFVNEIGERFDSDGGATAMEFLFESNGRSLQYSKERALKVINESLSKAGEPALSGDEVEFANRWLRFNDFRWIYKQAQKAPIPAGSSSGKVHRHGQPPSNFLQSAVALDQFKVGKYWSSGREIFARAFSTVIHEQMKEKGVINDFATKISAPQVFTGDEYLCSPNPEGSELDRVVEAAQPFLLAVQKKAKQLRLDTDPTEDLLPEEDRAASLAVK